MTATENQLMLMAMKVESATPREVLRMLKGFYAFPWESRDALGYNDWRRCIPNEVREVWSKLSLEGKLVAYLVASPIAAEWEPQDGS